METIEKLELFHQDSKVEVRECKREDGTCGKMFRGYAIVFDSPSVIMLEKKNGKNIFFREIVKRGAITQEFIDSQDVICTRQHMPDYIVARHRPNGLGSMRMTVDDYGVLCEFEFAESPMGRDCSAQVERGDLSGMSFMFNQNGYTFTDRKADDGIVERTITAFDIIPEVTIASYPAYPATTSQCREALMQLMDDADPDAEAQLREQQEREAQEQAEREKKTRESSLAAIQRDVELTELEQEYINQNF